jgi:TolB-like protein/Tfp pilus assembly protein PilF
LLDARGEPMVSDFGLAKWLDEESDLTRTLTTFGTPGYIAPESAEGASFSSMADIYSLGAILFNLLTGRPPFVGATALAVIRQAAATPAPKLRLFAPALGRDLETIVARCLERDPKARYQTAGALADDLERWLDGRPIVAQPVSVPARLWRWSRRNPTLAAAAAGCLLLGAAVVWLLREHIITSFSPKAPAIATTATSAFPEKSIAVLPFQNMSSDRENEYFVDGLTEEILNRIAQINELKVPGRASCFAFKDKNADLRQIGASLGVAHVLEGSVRKSRERLRITAELVRTLDGYHVWSQSFDRKVDDVFVIQEEIARAIADALSVQLKVGAVGHAERPTQDMLAYDNYLEARTLIAQRSPTNMRRAIPLFEAAVQRDPGFAKAWAALAQAHALAAYYLPIETTESLQNAENAARKALALDASLAVAHSALADVLRDRYRWSEAEAEYRRTLELSPGAAETHNQYAEMLLSVGHTDSALEHAERACELDPLAWVPSARRALVHLCRGELAESKEWADRSAKIRGHVGGFQIQLTLFYALAIKDVDLARWAIAQAGQVEWARPVDTKVLELTDEALAALSDHSRSPPDLAKAPREVQGLRSIGNQFLAAVAAFVGQKEAALQALSADSPSPPVLPESGNSMPAATMLSPASIWSPVFNPLRNEPRFLNLVRAMKLPDYWRVAGWGDSCRAKRGDDFECIGQIGPAQKIRIPEKSIAVLPFENLSEEKANAYFAEGIQNEILTRLSKIADLKVISRTSTQHYKSAPENLPQIARQLGVSHILEGTVQKSGDAVRVNVQLIKAATDSNLWADTFDRKLVDVFSVESDVAKAIADQLQAKLTGEEEQVIAAKPTDNVEAYDAYLRGLAYTLKTLDTPTNALGAQKYLREAVQLDPKFALSWALLSYVDSSSYLTQTLQPTDALREEARQAAETALALQPNLGEAVLAKGHYHYSCLKDYDAAVRYFEQARQLLANNSHIPESLAYVARRRGEWERSEAYFKEAERLDPRNVNLLAQRALSFIDLRRFPEALRKFDQVLNITPDDVDTLAEKAAIAQAEGDLLRSAALLAPLHPNADDTQALETQVYQAILERRRAPIISRLKEILAKPDPALGFYNGELRFWLAWAEEIAGDHAAARQSWRQARSELEPFLKEQPENHFLIGDLALTDMCLGDKAAALTLAERAITVIPIENDALHGPMPIEILARVAAQTGEPDRAIAALQKLLSIPYTGALAENVPLTPAVLRLDPMFDPLRNDPRFQKLAASSTPR